MPKNIKQTGKGKKLILSIAIAILFVIFISYAIETIYPSPKYEAYCLPSLNVPSLNQTLCETANFTWITYQNIPQEKTTPLVETGYCDTYTKCQKEYNDASEPYNRNLFFICLIIGIIVVVLSFILAVEAVSSGFMAGGVILMIYGTIRYWGNLSNVLRTIMIGIALVVLVWIGYRKLQ